MQLRKRYIFLTQLIFLSSICCQLSLGIKDVIAIPGETLSPISQNINPLCQIVNSPNGLSVHLRPTPNSPVVGNLSFNQSINLSPNYRQIRGPEGGTWVELVSPIKGFVSKGLPPNEFNLIGCQPTAIMPQPQPQPLPENIPNDNLCRQVNPQSAPNGLIVRADAARNATRLGKVFAGGRVTISPNSAMIPDKNGENRQWMAITAPLTGFVSAGNFLDCR